MSEVANWYSGKNILITGVTGFIGKVLAEKLLRTCPDIKKMYLFVRSKKGKTAEERKDILFENALFDTVKSSNPDVFKKVIIINANFTKNSLNIPAEDELKLINDCDVIFHNAASVQFDRGLHDVYNTNVLGFKYLLELSKKIKNLKAFIFCSTAFSQYTGMVLEEKGYKTPMEAETLHQLLDKFDEETINPLTKKLLGRHDNTYAFSKAVAEQMCTEYSKYFPIAIARPSIVCNMAYDPIPGWTQGVNGFNGPVIVGGIGISKVIHGNTELSRCVIPVDMASNGLVLIGWQTAIQKSKEIKYYNVAEDVSTAKLHPYGELKQYCNNAARKYPFGLTVMAFGYVTTDNKILFTLLDLYYHIFTGFLLDCLLVICGRSPMLIKAHRKIKHQMTIVHCYINNQFLFVSKNFNNLTSLLNDVDKKTFRIDIDQVLKREFFEKGSLGVRKYLLKQDPKTLPRSRRVQFVFRIVGRLIHASYLYFIIKYCYNKFINS